MSRTSASSRLLFDRSRTDNRRHWDSSFTSAAVCSRLLVHYVYDVTVFTGNSGLPRHVEVSQVWQAGQVGQVGDIVVAEVQGRQGDQVS